MYEKIMRVILSELEAGKRMRSELTVRLKNYPKQDRDTAIKQCIREGLIEMSVGSHNGVGRTPVYVEMTDDGKKRLEILNDKIYDHSIWSA
jgi:DNA-binding MarR family transcriptional regulator